MKRIGILSDTHGYLNPNLFDFFKDCDELWHAGDWGNAELMQKLETFKPIKGVYGNIDGQEIRAAYPEIQEFNCEGLTIFMVHIGGYPGHYAPSFRKLIAGKKPDVVVCGHSHILRVMRDPKNNWMLINPGACGNHGFQKSDTAIRLSIHEGRMSEMEVWDQKRR